ncbi:MAG: hypothetical protein ACK40X_14005, partial [Armatimonadota bacterium]
MSEVSQNLTGQGPSETETEQLEETGVVIYHSQTKSRYSVMAKVCQGNGKVSVNGTTIDEMMREGRIRRTEELLKVLSRERLKALDIDIRIGDSLPTEIL